MSASCLHATEEMIEVDPWYRQIYLSMKTTLKMVCSIGFISFMAIYFCVVLAFALIMFCFVKMIMVLCPEASLFMVKTFFYFLAISAIIVCVVGRDYRSFVPIALDVLVSFFNPRTLAFLFTYMIAPWGLFQLCSITQLPWYFALLPGCYYLYHQGTVQYWALCWITRAVNFVIPYKKFLNYVQALDDNLRPEFIVSDLARDGRIGNGYLSLLADACKENTNETSLFLASQAFDGYGVEKLAQVLNGQNATIQSIYLSNTRVGYRGAKAIAHLLESPNCMLTRLNLSGCALGLSGSRLIVESLRNNKILETLDISENQMNDGKLLGEVLNDNMKLRTINLSSSYLGDRGLIDLMQGLEGNQVLKELNLSNNQIGPNGVQALLPLMSQLQTLNLDRNCFGDEGAILLAESLATNNQLELLSVGWDLALIHGKRWNAFLECLRIVKPISAESGEAFLECLQVNHTLKNLYLNLSVKDDLSREIYSGIDDALRRNRRETPFLRVL